HAGSSVYGDASGGVSRCVRREESESHPPESNRRPTDYESVALPTELGWPGWRRLLTGPRRCRSSAAVRGDCTIASVHMGGPAKGGGESSSSRWKRLEAQPAAVRAHAVIGAEDAEIGQRLSQEKGAGEVKRVQRSDGLHGKRSLRALGDLPRQLENRPTSPGLG